MHVAVQIWCTVISTLMHTVANTNKYVDDIFKYWSPHLTSRVQKYEPQHSVEPRQLTTSAPLYLHSVHIQTVGLEVTQLSMFMRMHHPHIPYFALQCSGCIYSYGSYSW